MNEIFLLDAARTPFAPERGRLSPLRPEFLFSTLVNHLLGEGEGLSKQVGEICFGSDGAKPEAARDAVLLSRLTEEVCTTRFSGVETGGAEAVFAAISRLRAGESDLIFAGGAECGDRPDSKDRHPHRELLAKPETVVEPGLNAEGFAAGRFSRETLNEWAMQSHARASEAMDEGRLDSVILPLSYKSRRPGKGGIDELDVSLSSDEIPRDDLTKEAIAGLPPRYRRGGCISVLATAPAADGAALSCLATADGVGRSGRKAIAKVIASARIARSSGLACMAPVHALRKALEDAGMSPADLPVVFVDEFTAVTPLTLKAELALQTGVVNPDGGCIAFGRPGAATAPGMLARLIAHMKAKQLSCGALTFGSVSGEAFSLILENLDEKE